ncbi:MBL fold metallo-hydrolase [Brevibacillus migulae]|uniref:MBL fold metallo-hydrolase n=1 Tax=Brevibacillus migulae TaxID=1644114 RepID=UPI00106EA07D|nr:MBL fold metallo-hydrolase [Brevibacillus migulae]
MNVSIQFWGTSDAQGVPRMLCNCHVCSSEEKSNVRTRPSMLVEYGDDQILIDLSPDFRQQFFAFANKRVPDTVLFTHAHHDHIGGLGDFADLASWNQKKVNMVSPEDIIETILTRYPYLARRNGLHFQKEDTWQIGNLRIGFHRVNHGANGYSYGIRFETDTLRFAYVSDAINLTDAEWLPFFELDCLILGTSYWREDAPMSRRSVYSVEEVLPILEKLKPSVVYLTHLSHDIDHEQKESLLPKHVRFAYDGLLIALQSIESL